jgi:hypothetical protein
MVRRIRGLPTQPLSFENSPAVGRITISSPAILRSLADFNPGKKYCDRLKPFNFLLTCHVKPFGHPLGIDPRRFRLIAQYVPDPQQWLEMFWIDQYSGKRHRIITAGHHGTRKTARVKTYGDVIREYEFHPESKCADAKREPCTKQTVGLLQRRHVRIDQVAYIGKESNSLEDVESGLIHSEQNIYTEYSDPRRDEWATKIVPALQKVSLATLEKQTGMSRRMLIYARTGQRRPHSTNQNLLIAVARQLGIIRTYTPPPTTGISKNRVATRPTRRVGVTLFPKKYAHKRNQHFTPIRPFQS